MSSQAQAVQVILHLDRAQFLIGEAITPRLQITNNTGAPIRIGAGVRLSGSDWTWTPPNAVRLIGPDGSDLMQPYAQPNLSDAPIEIAPGSEHWQTLPLNAHLHLRTPGSYRLSVELAIEGDGVVRSDELRFELRDVVASLPPEQIGLEIAAPATIERWSGALQITATFTNHAAQPITLLKPQDDSYDGWVNPAYLFSVIDEAGRGLARALRSGSIGRPVYDDTNMITLAPGATWEQPLQLADIPALQPPGTYRIRLTYIVRDTAIGKGGAAIDQPLRWEPQVFIGRLESNELRITLR